MSPRRLFVLVSLIACIAQAQAATLAECEKVKLQQLKAQHSAQHKGRKKASTADRGPSRSRQNIDKLEEWLWKNCRSYGNELRSLEQGRM